MDEEALRRAVLKLVMSNDVLSMELRETQKTLLWLMAYVNTELGPDWKDSFVERRRELIERMLIRWEAIDPELAAQVQGDFEDDFEDWLDRTPDAEE